MANLVLIIGIALLIAGAALLVSGLWLVGSDFVSGLSGAMPIVPGALLVAWASRLKHKARSQDQGN